MKQKTIKIIYWIVTSLFCLLMLFSGISELMQTQQGNDLLISLGYPLYLNFILGVAKVLGVIALIQPKFRTIKDMINASEEELKKIIEEMAENLIRINNYKY
ncbi:MAG: DoxX family protein [Nanoarchaeota archaeon]